MHVTAGVNPRVVRATSLLGVDVAPARVPVPVSIPARARSAGFARTGARVVAGAAAFLSSYALLQILHATGHEPPFVRALSPIPLFARGRDVDAEERGRSHDTRINTGRDMHW